MTEEPRKKQVINFVEIYKALLSKKKIFLKVWIVVFILSCLCILPQPRYYTCEVSIAPESADGSLGGGGLASLASSFGVNIGGMESADAIYPELYPDLFESNEFLVDLLDIKITTEDKTLATDYYDYLKNHQKKNILLFPLQYVSNQIKKLLEKPEEPIKGSNGKRFDPFHLSKSVNGVVKLVGENVSCNYSKMTSVVTISVKDQDPLVCALLADSIKEHLQAFITDYRTKKARIDYEHYKKLTLEAKAQYDEVQRKYVGYADANTDVSLPSVKATQDNLENDMQMKYNVYTAMNARLEAAMTKVQEKTPVFTTLKSASVPLKPAGPKRMIFVALMMVLSTLVTIAWQFRKELAEWF